jgi:hypothetical protein
MQSHSELAKYFGVDEDKLLKIDYNWVDKTIDIFGDNQEQNETAAFMPKESHYRAIQSFIEKKVGTKEKLIQWLADNKNDNKICAEADKLLSEQGNMLYEGSKASKVKFDLDVLKKAFLKYPNLVWRDSNGKRCMA